MPGPLVSIVVAYDRQRLIGAGGGLPWRLPADLKRFRAITMGKPLLMGRRTYTSIGRPLPGRTSLVLTSKPGFAAPGCIVVPDFATALARARDLHEEVMVIGGAEVYRQALPGAQRMYVTEVDAVLPGDTFFPGFDPEDWSETARETHCRDSEHAYPFAFVVFERKNS